MTEESRQIELHLSTSETSNHSSIGTEIENTGNRLLKLGDIAEINILYCTCSGQLFFRNASDSVNYYIQLTIGLSNTIALGVIPYSTLQKSLEPGKCFYLSFTGEKDARFNVLCPNEKIIVKDITFIPEGKGVTYGADLNNQNLGDKINRILMSIVETKAPVRESIPPK